MAEAAAYRQMSGPGRLPVGQGHLPVSLRDSLRSPWTASQATKDGWLSGGRGMVIAELHRQVV
jgi:hypothetical protein